MKMVAKATKVERTAPEMKSDGNTEVYFPGVSTVRLTDESGNKFVFEQLGFDFKQCSRIDLVRIATQQLQVRFAQRFRNAFLDGDKKQKGDPMKVAGQWDRTWDVKSEFIDVERSTKSPEEKATDALAVLEASDPDALKALIAKYTEQK